MNEAEKRRKRLLEETRSKYSDSFTSPAVHPRYGAVYNGLYGENSSSQMPLNTLGGRTLICVLLFALFVAADYKKTSIASVDSKRIVNEITYDLNLVQIWNNL